MKYSEAFLSHKGKYSDKWSQYLDVYDQVLRGLGSPKSILEIGVQNGGSLEIWSELYPEAENIVGIDIDKRCAELAFNDQRIRVIIGDAKTDESFERIAKLEERFDLVVDDGSHTSEDIILNFMRYLPALNPGGLYLIEDLHASYWASFGGSLFGTESAVSYLKRMIDILNIQHWNQSFTQEEILSYLNFTPSENFKAATKQIAEIRFFDSIAVFRMASEFKSQHYQFRVNAGTQSMVNSEPRDLVGTKLTPPFEDRNNTNEHGPISSEEYLTLKRQVTSILESKSWRWTSVLRKLAAALNRT